MRWSGGRFVLLAVFTWFVLSALRFLFMTLVYHLLASTQIILLEVVVAFVCGGFLILAVLALLSLPTSDSPVASPSVRVRLRGSQIWRLSLAMGASLGVVMYPYLLLSAKAGSWLAVGLTRVLVLLLFVVASVWLTLSNQRRALSASLLREDALRAGEQEE
jgi:hypothetical protein